MKRSIEQVTFNIDVGEKFQKMDDNKKADEAKKTEELKKTEEIKKAEDNKYLHVGDAVTIFFKWQGKIDYNFSSITRGSPRETIAFKVCRSNYEFPSLPRNWMDIVKKHLIKTHIEKWKSLIYDKNKLYDEYDSWNITIVPSIKIFDIEVKDIDAVSITPDFDFE